VAKLVSPNDNTMGTTTLRQFPSLESVDLSPTAPLHLAVGMFDGLHLGHQTVIGQALQAATSAPASAAMSAKASAAQCDSGIAAVLTFWPHPSHLLRPDAATRMLMRPSDKARVLGKLGISALITQPFTQAFAALEAEAVLPYFKRALPGLVAIYVGENWRFGRERRGDLALLKAQGAAHSVEVVGLPRLCFEGEPISSTRIRAAIERGEIEQANAMLGYPYFAQGVVASGRGLGRTIGSPTLNIEWQPELQPRYGVYAVEVSAVGAETDSASSPTPLPGIANYGLRPTVGTQLVPQLEVFVLAEECHWDKGDELLVELRHFIRPEQKFSGLDALTTQITKDTATAREWLAAKPRAQPQPLTSRGASPRTRLLSTTRGAVAVATAI